MSLLNLKFIDFLNQMTDPRKDALLAIYNDYKDIFHQSPGSGTKHQAWQGGYADHITECFRINKATYKALNDMRPLPFTEDSALIVLFFHDMEKPFRRIPADHPVFAYWKGFAENRNNNWETVKWDVIDQMKDRYGFTFTDDELNALKYTHGEGDDHNPTKRIASPLAAHIHHCDNTSARIYFDDGRALS